MTDIVAVLFGVVFAMFFVYFYIYKLLFGIVLGKIEFMVGLVRIFTVLFVILIFAMGLGVFQELVESVFYGKLFSLRPIYDYIYLVVVHDTRVAVDFMRQVVTAGW